MITKLENLGCAKSVVGLVIPTGYSFNLDGTSIYLTMAAIFIAQATNVPPEPGPSSSAILGVLLLTSKGAAAVTGGGFITLAATLESTGKVPVAGLALLLGIDRFMSEARAITNLIGNGVATMVVARWEGALDLAARSRCWRSPPVVRPKRRRPWRTPRQVSTPTSRSPLGRSAGSIRAGSTRDKSGRSSNVACQPRRKPMTHPKCVSLATLVLGSSLLLAPGYVPAQRSPTSGPSRGPRDERSPPRTTSAGGRRRSPRLRPRTAQTRHPVAAASSSVPRPSAAGSRWRTTFRASNWWLWLFICG